MVHPHKIHAEWVDRFSADRAAIWHARDNFHTIVTEARKSTGNKRYSQIQMPRSEYTPRL